MMVTERIISEMWRIQMSGRMLEGRIEHIFPNIKLTSITGMMDTGNA
jgi:hypothetical protein